MKSFLICLWVLLACTGCTSLANIFITPHPNSLRDGLASLEAITDFTKCPVPVPKAAAAPAIVVPFVIAAVQSFLSTEGAQYSASYSAAETTFLDISDASGQKELKCIVFKRVNGQSDLLRVEASVIRDRLWPTFSMDDLNLKVKGFKSKVTSWPIVTLLNGGNPWSGDSVSSKIGNTIGFINPFMMLHAFYGLLSPEIYEVDVKVTTKFDALMEQGNQVDLKTLSQAALPFGRVSVLDITRAPDKTATKSLKGTTPPFIPLPNELVRPPGGANKARPINITVSVNEGSDFGDVVGKAAGLVKDQKGDIATQMKDWLGIK